LKATPGSKLRYEMQGVGEFHIVKLVQCSSPSERAPKSFDKVTWWPIRSFGLKHKASRTSKGRRMTTKNPADKNLLSGVAGPL
jgi:hypothetical protein